MVCYNAAGNSKQNFEVRVVKIARFILHDH